MYLLWMKECCFRYTPCLPSKSSPALPLLSHAPSLSGRICEEETATEAGSSESKEGDLHLPSGLQDKAERGEASKLRAFALEKEGLKHTNGSSKNDLCEGRDYVCLVFLSSDQDTRQARVNRQKFQK